MRLLTILMCVFFLSGFGWFNSIDCEDVVDSALYDEGISHLNERERKMRRMIYRSNQDNKKAVEKTKGWVKRRTRPYYIEICEIYKEHEMFK